MKTRLTRHLLISLAAVLAVAASSTYLYLFRQSTHQSSQWQSIQTSIALQQSVLKQDQARLKQASGSPSETSGPLTVSKQSDFIRDLSSLASQTKVTVMSVTDGTSNNPANGGSAATAGMDTVQLSGSYNNLLAFIGTFQQQLPSISIEEADLPITKTATTLTLQVTVPTRG